jgi:uncharacterized iron-regulated protein
MSINNIVVPGDADTDFHFPDLTCLDEMAMAVLEQSASDKAAYDQLIASGVTKDQAFKIILIRLLMRKNTLAEAIITALKEPALHVAVPVA